MEQTQQKHSQFKGQPRLPKFAVAKHYDRKLVPDLVTCKFVGTVDISVKVVFDTKFLVLNVVDSKSVRFTPQNGSKVSEDPNYLGRSVGVGDGMANTETHLHPPKTAETDLGETTELHLRARAPPSLSLRTTVETPF